MYSLIYSENARKWLKKSSEDDKQRIISALERLRLKPSRYIKRIIGTPYLRLRVGVYRIIIIIKGDKIFIAKIGHRRNIYK